MGGNGGARPGAGRPRTGKALKMVTVSLTQEQHQMALALAQRDSESLAAIVRRMVEYARRNARKGEL